MPQERGITVTSPAAIMCFSILGFAGIGSVMASPSSPERVSLGDVGPQV
jgi:hypothetical protein